MLQLFGVLHFSFNILLCVHKILRGNFRWRIAFFWRVSHGKAFWPFARDFSCWIGQFCLEFCQVQDRQPWLSTCSRCLGTCHFPTQKKEPLYIHPSINFLYATRQVEESRSVSWAMSPVVVFNATPMYSSWDWWCLGYAFRRGKQSLPPLVCRTSNYFVRLSLVSLHSVFSLGILFYFFLLRGTSHTTPFLQYSVLNLMNSFSSVTDGYTLWHTQE